MELTYAEKKTIERALAILERNEDERAKRFAIENKGIYVSPLAIIEAAEKKHKESEEKFETARKKWEE